MKFIIEKYLKCIRKVEKWGKKLKTLPEIIFQQG